MSNTIRVVLSDEEALKLAKSKVSDIEVLKSIEREQVSNRELINKTSSVAWSLNKRNMSLLTEIRNLKGNIRILENKLADRDKKLEDANSELTRIKKHLDGLLKWNK